MVESNNFQLAFNRVINHEGGYSDNPKDPGNWTGGAVKKGLLKGTKYGIAAVSYPSLDIKNLTLEEAKNIYKKDYWDKNNLDLFDKILAFQIFDAAVNHGNKQAVKFIQSLVGVTEDGILGSVTANAIKSENQKKLAIDYVASRIAFYTKLKTFNSFGKGWMNRMCMNVMFLGSDID